MKARFAVKARFLALLLILTFIPLARSAEATNKLDWWSFKPAQRRNVPPTERPRWIRNPIDAFVSAKLSEHRLAPSPEADRRTLIRRVTFDLIGLPPTPEELNAFVGDTNTNAYERVVERLLASPRYGERSARHWLDAVHYGESHGYDKDKPRLNAWPYRDYVIRAFNSDKRYSRFVEEQLAGDVLFPDDPDGIVALGFIAAGPWDFVGHVELPITKTDGLLARYNDRDDMVMNAMSTFQSLTVHCARCHDHKFDAITQRDYYGLQAVFAGVDRADRPFDAEPEVARQRRQLTEVIGLLTDELKLLDSQVTRLGGAELREIDRRIADLRKTGQPNKAAFGYHSRIEATPDVTKWVQIDLGATQAIERIVFVGCHDDFNNIGAGFGFPPRYRIEVSDDAELRAGVTVVEDRTREDVPNPGVTPQTVRAGSETGAPTRARFVRFTATKLASRQNDFIFALAELMVLNASGAKLANGATVTALDSIEAPVRWQKKNLVDGYYFGALTNAVNSGELAGLESERRALLEREAPAAVLGARAEKEKDLNSAREQMARLPKAQMVYAAAADFAANGSFVPSQGPRPVHLLKRGDVKKPGEEMQPAAVASVPGVSSRFRISDLQNEAARRAALAKWITDTNNMLTRRSVVNRVWACHFGRGIVETPNDFGHMGALPTHPELLDWLAFWFLDNGESFKKLHRLIVTSATYRQASSPAAVEVTRLASKERDQGLVTSTATGDSGNRLRSRMNRARLDAEQFHDALLAISGKLDPPMGGPSVQQFHFKDDHSPVYDYARYDFTGPGANRRSIYRFMVRSVPDPFMDALDCPDANTLTPVRNVTTTALQALATLNDAFVLRQCEHFAERLQRERESIDERLVRAFELALSRSPTERERAKLAAHAQKHGLASACRVLFNSNELMFID